MTTTPDFRALCAELTVKLEYWMSAINRHPLHSVELVDRARAALATPPPEPPTDEEILSFVLTVSTGNKNTDFYLPQGLPSDWDDEDFIAPPEAIVTLIRDALERWG